MLLIVEFFDKLSVELESVELFVFLHDKKVIIVIPSRSFQMKFWYDIGFVTLKLDIIFMHRNRAQQLQESKSKDI